MAAATVPGRRKLASVAADELEQETARRDTPLRVNHAILAALETALDRLEVFADPDNPDCGVNNQAREAARAYVVTWGIRPLETALRSIKGEGTPEDRLYLRGLMTGFPRR